MLDPEVLQRRLERERLARLQAESILEQRGEALYEANEELRRLTETLEARVAARTADLAEARDEAHKATAAKSRFLATMSHEIRTPLTAVLGYAEILQDKMPKEGALTEYVADLRRNAKHLYSLLGEILDISRIEAGTVEVSQRWANLPELLRSGLAATRDAERGASLEISTAVTTALPQRVLTDATKLRQVLVNLLSNAVKYTDAGSVVLRISFSQEGDTASLRLEVEDTGCGIAEEALESIFDSYTRVGSSATDDARPGVGLGLEIARRLVRMLGGDIDVRSELGQGSTFGVTVPLAAEGWQDLTAPDGFRAVLEQGLDLTEASPPLTGTRILIADDFDSNFKILAHAVTDAGGTPYRARDGLEACAAVESAVREGRPFDIVLMDLRMPRMGGLEATRRLRSAGHAMPVVAVTADVTNQMHLEAAAAGCEMLLPKPIPRADLLTAIVQLLHGHDEDHVGEADELVLPQALRTAFAASCRESAQSLVSALAARDAATIARIGHQLAGTGASYGHHVLTDLGRRVEAQALDADALELGEGLIRELVRELERVAEM